MYAAFRVRPIAFFLPLLAVSLLSGAARAQETGFYIEPITPPGSIFDAVDVEVAADGRIFVLMKGGWLRVVLPDGTLLDEPWLYFGGEVLNVAERGLLGFALHPDFPATPDIYFVYTVDDSPLPQTPSYSRAYGRVTRYSAAPADPNRADLASRHVVLGENFHDGIPSCYNHHSIGTIAFGHDGSLFVGSGDGSGAPVQPDIGGQYDECFSENPDEGVHPDEDIGLFRSQSLESLGGKILRIDPETGDGYPDNPFYTGDPADTASKVWALGFRNPFRFTVVPAEPGEAGPGTLLIGDVGQANWEEINRSTGGENFGWPCYEGPEEYAVGQSVTGPLACSEPRAGVPTEPYAYFSHSYPERSSPAGVTAYSVTGGVVYTGTAYPEAYQGALFFADYANQWIRSARLGAEGMEGVAFIGEDVGHIVDLTPEPATGELIGADVIHNQIVRLRYAGSGGSPPVARLTASARTGAVGTRFDFDATASLDPDGGDLAYQWTFGDGATAEGPEVSHTYVAQGVFPATVVVTDSDGQESRASLSIRIGGALPVVTIESPTAYVIPANGRVRLQASATDPIDAAETFAFEWAVDLLHNDHIHRRFFYTEEAVGEFILDPHGGPGETTHYRATVTVTDGEGLVSSASRTLRTVVPAEIDVVPAALPMEIEDGVEVTFPRPFRVGRVGLPGLSEAPDGLAVEVRQDGAWAPVRFPSVLAEGDTLQVLFVEAEADGVRVVGADRLSVYGQVDPDAVLPGGGEGLDVGAPVATGRAGVGVQGALVVVGGGAVRDGAFHMVRQVVSGDGGVSARVAAVTGTTPTAGAGVAMRASTASDALGATLLAEPDGILALWNHGADGRSVRTEVGTWDGPTWLRLRRDEARLAAEASSDGEAWTRLDTRLLSLPTDLLAGPAVAAGDRDSLGLVAVGWFDDVAVTGAGQYPEVTPTGPFAIRGVYPNPSREAAVLVLDAGRSGTYAVDLVDVLGRVVWRGAPVSMTELRYLTLPLGVSGLGAGTYVARVRHVESGETVTEVLTVAR